MLEKRFIMRLVKLDRCRHVLSTLASNKIQSFTKNRSNSYTSANSETSNDIMGIQESFSPPLTRNQFGQQSVTALSPVVEDEEGLPMPPYYHASPNSSEDEKKSFKPFSKQNDQIPGAPGMPPSPPASLTPRSSKSSPDNSVHNPMMDQMTQEKMQTAISNSNIAHEKDKTWRSALPFLRFGALQDLNTQKVKDVFLEIVADDDMDDEGDELSRDSSATKLFWMRMGQLSDGALRVMTYNGLLCINKRTQAKIFGKRLYVHLSRQGKVTVTAGMLRNAMRTIATEKVGSLLQPPVTGHPGNATDRADRTHGFEEDIKGIVDELTILFELSSDDSAAVTEKCITGGVLEAYKEMKFATSSLYDFSGLQQSLRAVIDFLFWILMAVVAQCVLQYDLSTVLAPGITLILIMSFALGPFFGNMFLSVAFVFFMLPFDIGDRCLISSMSGHCHIMSIGLLHTTVRSLFGETIFIPNHTLFSEKIYNFCQSEGMTYEIIMHFPFSGPARCSEEKIEKFNKMLKDFCLVEKRDDWKSFWAIYSGVDVSVNRVNYSYWVTHHCNLSQPERVVDARTAFYKRIRSLAHELEISYTSAVLPVYTIAERINTKKNMGEDEEENHNIQPPMHLNFEPPISRPKMD
jgi:small-conductance mechanosensitive channel